MRPLEWLIAGDSKSVDRDIVVFELGLSRS